MPTHDVIIYGATPAGCFAAIQLARYGRNVAVIEPSQFKGGMITGGLGISDAAATRTWSGVVQEFVDACAAVTGWTSSIDKWNFPANVAKEELEALIAAETITFYHGEWITAVHKNEVTPALGADVSAVASEGSLIASVDTNLDSYTADHWIDCSYEGDLAAMAGCTMTYGRDARSTYGENNTGQNNDTQAVSAYAVVDADGDLYTRCQHAPAHKTGEADATIMAVGFRLMATNDPAKIVPWPMPPGYNRNDFLDEIHEANSRGMSVAESHQGFITRRVMNDGHPVTAITPVTEYATNGSDIIGPGAWEYLRLTPPERVELAEQMAYRMLGRFYTLANDGAVPSGIRASFSSMGLCNDQFQTEYILVPGWSHTLYVREARRLVGKEVVTWREAGDQLNWPHQLCVAAYFSDSKASYQVALADGTTAREGVLSEENSNFVYWGVPMEAVLPAAGQADNLVVPVCASMSKQAWGSYRLEPIWSQAGANSAVMIEAAIREGKTVNAVGYEPVRLLLVELNNVFARY